MSRAGFDIYVGEENGRTAKRHLEAAPELALSTAHTHPCQSCKKSWYCWCQQGDSAPQMCSGCSYEALLPKVIDEGKGWDWHKRSRLFSDIEVSQGGWTSRWVTTHELRAALSRWVSQEYEASPKEVSEEGGAYQCGGCRFFLALDSDYGICANQESRYDGRIVFEHVGCEANPHYIRNHPTARALKEGEA